MAKTLTKYQVAPVHTKLQQFAVYTVQIMCGDECRVSAVERPGADISILLAKTRLRGAHLHFKGLK